MRRRVMLGFVLAALLTGCTDTRAPVAAPSLKAPTPLPAAPLLPPRSPFTGLPADLAAPVLAVKIDNVAPARPQTGTTAADLVYVEPVEGGLTRLLAVFQSRIPPVIGPVRSIRETDLQLLARLSAPALAFSGEAPELRPLLAGAPVVDVSASAVPAAYYRDRDRPSPHNVYARTAALSGGGRPCDVGFRFGPLPADGRATVHVTVAVRRVGGHGRGRRAARRAGVRRDVVAALPGGADDIHPARRHAADVRHRAGVDPAAPGLRPACRVESSELRFPRAGPPA